MSDVLQAALMLLFALGVLAGLVFVLVLKGRL